METRLDDIIMFVCDHYKYDESILRTKLRNREAVLIRQVIWYIAKHIYGSGVSVTALGMKFNRDHATVLHGLKALKDVLDTDRPFRDDFHRLYHKVSAYIIDLDRKVSRVTINTDLVQDGELIVKVIVKNHSIHKHEILSHTSYQQCDQSALNQA